MGGSGGGFPQKRAREDVQRGQDPTILIQLRKGTSLRRVMKSGEGARWMHQAGFRKGRCDRTPPLHSQGAGSPCYAGPLLTQAEGPSGPPRWVLSTWPEQDREQYKQHTAQIQVPAHSTQGSPSPELGPRDAEAGGRAAWRLC